MEFRNIQKEVYQNKLNKGFNVTNVDKEFCLLYGEVGEAFDAFRKGKSNFAEELADVAIFLLGIAEIKNVDLGAEILRKMEIIEKRKYRNENGVMIKLYEQDNT